MNRLSDNSLAQLLPNSLKQDPFVVALAEAVEMELKKAYKEAADYYNLTNIDKVPEVLLDYLAFDRHVDFYETNLPVQQKRELIKNSPAWHRKKGTRWAVEEVTSIVFSSAEVKEWFEYNGDPYHFKVLLNHHTIKAGDLTRLRSLINATKNKRSKLESIDIITKSIISLFNRTYEFDVPYKICNRFQTEAKPGILAKSPFDLREKAYSFGVVYPITNMFTTQDITGRFVDGLSFKAEATSNEVLYPRVGVTTVSSGSYTDTGFAEASTTMQFESNSNDIKYKRVGNTTAGEGTI